MDLTKDDVDSRRITRQSRNRGVFAVDLRPRSALKRKRNFQPTSVNGSEEQRSVSAEDEGSPDKIKKLQIPDCAGDTVLEKDKDQSDTVEMDQIEHQDQEMSSEDENENSEAVLNIKPLTEENVIKTVRIVNLETDEMRTFLQRQKNVHRKTPALDSSKVTGNQITVPSSATISRVPSRAGLGSFSPKLPESMENALTARSSISEYREKMEQKAKDVSTAELQDTYKYPYRKSHTPHINQTNNIPAKKQYLEGTSTESKKAVITKASSTSASRAYGTGFGGLCKWLLCPVFLLALLALSLMGYQHLPDSSFFSRATENPNMMSSESFKARLAVLKSLFPSQHTELWKRIEIHLQRHLNLINPNEPVSLILASGRGAEKTLGCLALQIATAFTPALNSSVLSIDGTTKRAQDSDQVKLDIDRELREAFDGGTQAAIIHRFEELPPGSTLIFYRYCDHENAAYKKVFLAFTVMLPVNEVDLELRLKEVEEQVHEYLKSKFVSSESEATFKQMDVDKLSGLWSRISHVILPVATEHTIEQKGCGN